jgi:site-specific DNA-methyltransferase (adenine-specific)
MVIYKLMIGLKDWEPNDEKRYKHIVENMIYVAELQPKNMFLYMCAVDPFDKYKLNVYTGSFLENEFDYHMKTVWNIEKFDLVIGNPPYQEMDGGAKASAKPIYNLFTEKSLIISNIVLFITPSRWFAGGKGLNDFRNMMMNSGKIKVIKDFPGNGSEQFGKSVNIGGGVSFFLYDNMYNGECLFNDKLILLSKYDIIIRNTKVYDLIDKISKNKSMESICRPRSFYGVQTNDIRLLNENSENTITCYVSQQKGFVKYIERDLIDDEKLSIHKVCTPRALGRPEDGLGNIFYADNNSIVSDSYMFLVTSNKKEADSLISYLKTNFIHFLICIRKIDSTVKPSTFKWVPSVPLDREWNDDLIFEYFNLSKEEIELILENKKY